MFLFTNRGLLFGIGIVNKESHFCFHIDDANFLIECKPKAWWLYNDDFQITVMLNQCLVLILNQYRKIV